MELIDRKVNKGIKWKTEGVSWAYDVFAPLKKGVPSVRLYSMLIFLYALEVIMVRFVLITHDKEMIYSL